MSINLNLSGTSVEISPSASGIAANTIIRMQEGLYPTAADVGRFVERDFMTYLDTNNAANNTRYLFYEVIPENMYRAFATLDDGDPSGNERFNIDELAALWEFIDRVDNHTADAGTEIHLGGIRIPKHLSIEQYRELIITTLATDPGHNETYLLEQFFDGESNLAFVIGCSGLQADSANILANFMNEQDLIPILQEHHKTLFDENKSIHDRLDFLQAKLGLETPLSHEVRATLPLLLNYPMLSGLILNTQLDSPDVTSL